MNLFEISRPGPGRHISLILPAGAAVRGLAYQESATAGTAELADGTKPIVGFSTREVKVDGPALGDVVFPGRLELPFKAGQEGSFEQAEEVQAEGTDYIVTDGAGAVSSGTALETEMSFLGGKWQVKQSGQKIFGHLKEIMTPEVAGALRIRVQMVNFTK